MSRRVSLIVPVYNGEETIGNCIQFLDSQTESNLEIIIVNDGSTDQTESIVQDMMKTLGKKCIYKYQENQGEFLGRVNGLHSASGEYIAFLDADDEIEPDYVESMMNIQGQYDADLLVCGIRYMKSERISKPSENGYRTNELLDSRNQLPDFVFSQFFNSVCNKLYKAELLRESLVEFMNRNLEEKRKIASLARDAYMNTQYFRFIKTIVFTDYPQYIYNFNPHSITENFHRDYYKSMFFFCNEKNILLAECSPRDFRKASDKYLIKNVYLAFSYVMHNAQKEKYSTRFSFFRAVSSEFQNFPVSRINHPSLPVQEKVILFLFRRRKITILTLMTYIPLAVMKKITDLIQGIFRQKWVGA